MTRKFESTISRIVIMITIGQNESYKSILLPHHKNKYKQYQSLIVIIIIKHDNLGHNPPCLDAVRYLRSLQGPSADRGEMRHTSRGSDSFFLLYSHVSRMLSFDKSISLYADI